MFPSISVLFQASSSVFVIKIGILILLVLFAFFVIVLWKQIKTMNQIVTQPSLYPLLQAVTLLLGLATLVLFVTTLVIL